MSFKINTRHTSPDHRIILITATISPSPRSQVRGGQTQFTQAARGGLRSAIRAPSSLARWRVVRPELGNLAGCVNGQLPGVPLFNIIIICQIIIRFL